ncbi:hypothetical protein DRW41_19605 [Neobacillus piezotolerans]|uniref:EF-hand domain-containing protein n=1 Tax=Neobacillus piezotolerans TaxID=2259171 RepID=A0A3D8GL48_9BACI|nr:hypothetical protein [Neobacillus piezotolerans]RDU35153.1 hypothetical protein DRW41_19605 [Neobacillus piezotolerans]
MIKKITLFLLGLLMLAPVGASAAAESKIMIDMHYLVVSPAEDGSTNMMNMVNYTNTDPSEYKGDGKSGAVLTVTLPEGSTSLNFLDGKIAMEQTEKGFITTDPIPGGQTIVLPYSYRMPAGKEINLTFDYPAQIMQVLVPEGMGSIEFKGAEATNQGLFNFEDQKYVGYSVESIPANEPVIMIYNKDIQPKVDEANQAGADKGKENVVTKQSPAFHNPGHLRMWYQSPLKSFNPHVLMIVLAAILIAGISYFSYFRLKNRAEAERLENDADEKAFKLLMAKQNTIMDKILELEDTYGNGLLTEEEYNAKIDAYKQHLVKVKLGLRRFVE